MRKLLQFNRWPVLAGALALLVMLPLRAGQEVVLNRGFDAAKSYATGEVDAIDSMTGNLVVRVPLGGEYGSNGTLRYSFGLTYNSNIWDHQLVMTGGFVRYIALEYEDLYADYDRLTDNDLPPLVNGTESFPAAGFNAGVGWTMSLGHLRGAYAYVAPDGSEHQFYKKLHGDVSSGDSADDTGPAYTRDGSYLRMTKLSSNERLVEFPDGMRRRFVCGEADPTKCTSDPYAKWHLSELADPFGNLLYVVVSSKDGQGRFTVTYKQVTATAGGQTAYYARPSDVSTLVRTHTFTYREVKPYQTILESATIAAPGGGATYTFGYDENRTIYREYGSTWAGPGLRVPFDPSTKKVAEAVLTSIALPASSGNWLFDYTKIAPGGADADLVPVTWGEGSSAFTYQTSKLDGRLDSVTLPTGGRIEYEYAPRAIPARHCATTHGENGALGTLGIKTRTTFDVGSATPAGTWRYYSSRYRSDSAPPSSRCNFAKELVSTTIAPDGATAVSFYSVYWDSSNYADGQPWVPSEYGLPMTKAVNDSADGSIAASTRFLSTQVYQCTPGVFETGTDDRLKKLLAHHRAAGEPGTCGLPLVSTYVRYENSGADCDGEIASDCKVAMRRKASEKKLYHGRDASDPDTFETTDWSDYDGLGHYRTATMGGNIFKTIFPSTGTPGSDQSTRYTSFNPLAVYNPVTRSLNAIPARWLLESHDRTVARERPNGDPNKAENVATTEYLFNADTGALLRRRTLAGDVEGGRTAGDLLSIFTRTVVDATTVNVTESAYGGDGQGVLRVDQSLDLLTLPSSKPEYIIERHQKHGATLLTRYMKCDGAGVAYTVENNTIDAPSGLVTASTDNAGLTTGFGYDALSRLTSLTPPGESGVTYRYDPSTSSRGATATVNRGSGLTATSTVSSYDGFGRIRTTEGLVPDDTSSAATVRRCTTGAGCWSHTETEYFADGKKLSDSDTVFKGASAGSRRRFLKYDALGRLVSRATPDSKKTTFAYFGSWHVREETPSLGPVDRYYDRRGRLVKITTGNGAQAYRYEYDSSDRLRTVFNTTGGSESQRARFDYDNRGFLTGQSSAENNGKTVKFTYDARGNRLSKSYPSVLKAYDLEYQYDDAERLSKVSQGTNKLIKELLYYPNGVNGAGGKVLSATRTNRIPKAGLTDQFDVYDIVQQYEYKPGTGRVGALTTTSSALALSARQEYEYDVLGQLTTLRYPSVPGTPAARTVNPDYRNGRLTAVPNYLPEIYYHADGSYKKIVRNNGTYDQQDLDLSLDGDDGLWRPGKIAFYKTSGTQPIGQFGPISYSGAGNITNVVRLADSDRFGYDDRGRLTSATVRGTSQVIEYDSRDNIDRITTSSGTTTATQLLGPLPATNRLGSATYDDAGYMLTLPDLRDSSNHGRAYSFQWDATGNMTGVVADRLRRTFLYDARDERIVTLDYVTGVVTNPPIPTQLWTIRDFNQRVLADFKKSGGGGIERTRDYVFGVGSIAAVVEVGAGGAESVRHLHTDHLGTPRVITDGTGKVVSRREYLPFGRELVDSNGPGRLEFTGHERDEDGTAADEGDFDDMHARFYAPWIGRFLSLDSELGQPDQPQSWNRYSYVCNNPVNNMDPTGRATVRLIASHRTAEQKRAELAQIGREALEAGGSPGRGIHPAAAAEAIQNSLTAVERSIVANDRPLIRVLGPVESLILAAAPGLSRAAQALTPIAATSASVAAPVTSTVTRSAAAETASAAGSETLGTETMSAMGFRFIEPEAAAGGSGLYWSGDAAASSAASADVWNIWKAYLAAVH